MAEAPSVSIVDVASRLTCEDLMPQAVLWHFPCGSAFNAGSLLFDYERHQASKDPTRCNALVSSVASGWWGRKSMTSCGKVEVMFDGGREGTDAYDVSPIVSFGIGDDQENLFSTTKHKVS